MKFLNLFRKSRFQIRRGVHYVQGQSPEPKVREYFYFIDHQGQLFLDDSKMKNFTSCFKEKAFLEFFFSRLRFNETSSYPEFPYLSPCGRERNYIRCDDRPVVYTQIVESNSDTENDKLLYGMAGPNTKLRVEFEPEKICMLPDSGRIYHPALAEIGGVGLIKSSIAITISKDFMFENGEENTPTHFTWKGVKHELTNELLPFMALSPYEAREKLHEVED